MKRVKWTDEVIQFMIDNYKGKDNVELANLLNEKFNLNTNCSRVSNIKANLKRRQGIDLTTGINNSCFKKGHIPANKGKTWDEYMSKEGQANSRKTCYKKGNIPMSHREVGEERTTVDGYIEIKVAEPNKWKLKHRVIYEKAFGKIPEGYNVIFLDGNKQNLELSNLKVISKHEDLIMNRHKLFTNDKNLTTTGTLIAKVMKETYEKVK